MSDVEHEEHDLPALAELEEDQDTPSARQRAQRRLPLNRRRAWSQVIEGQVLDVLALEQAGESRHGGRRPDGRPRGLAALIPETPADGPVRHAAPRTAPAVAVETTPGPIVPLQAVPAPGQRPDAITIGIPTADLDPTPEPAPAAFERPPLDTGPLRAVFARLRPRTDRPPAPPGDASAAERLTHPDTGWCTFDGLPGHHLLDVAQLDIQQLDHAQRHFEVLARSGTVLVTRCGDISPRALMHASYAPPTRCEACEAATTT